MVGFGSVKEFNIGVGMARIKHPPDTMYAKSVLRPPNSGLRCPRAGMAKVFFDLPLFVILLVGYLLCLVLTMLADEAAIANPKPMNPKATPSS